MMTWQNSGIVQLSHFYASVMILAAVRVIELRFYLAMDFVVTVERALKAVPLSLSWKGFVWQKLW